MLVAAAIDPTAVMQLQTFAPVEAFGSARVATAFAVEVAVIHNFVWHEQFTWLDRVRASARSSWLRLLRFNLTTGGVSIVGNLALMKLLAGMAHMNYFVANGIAIVLCSLVNFVASEEWVFEG